MIEASGGVANLAQHIEFKYNKMVIRDMNAMLHDYGGIMSTSRGNDSARLPSIQKSRNPGNSQRDTDTVDEDKEDDQSSEAADNDRVGPSEENGDEEPDQADEESKDNTPAETPEPKESKLPTPAKTPAESEKESSVKEA